MAQDKAASGRRRNRHSSSAEGDREVDFEYVVQVAVDLNGENVPAFANFPGSLFEIESLQTNVSRASVKALQVIKWDLELNIVSK